MSQKTRYVGTNGSISDELLKQISLLKHLAAFHFYFNQAQDNDVQLFANMKSLESFCVAGAGVTSPRLKHLVDSPFTCLRVAQTQVDEVGIRLAGKSCLDLR